MDKDTRKLNLLKDFTSVAGTSIEQTILSQVGWQKVDELTVLERKAFPIVITTRGNDHAMVRMDVYDFSNYTVTTYNMSNGDDCTHLPPVQRNFSDVEGKQCIRDAHRALVELGGCPPPLDEIMGYIVELKKNVSISPPLKLKSNP